MLLRRISILAVLALSLGTSVAMADANNRFNQKVAQTQSNQGVRNKGQFMQELGLSPEQVEQIRAIRKKYKSQITQQRQELKQAQGDLENMIASTASSDEIRQKHGQIQSLRQQLEEAQFNSLLEMREILSPEQRSKYVQLMQSRRTKSLKQTTNRK